MIFVEQITDECTLNHNELVKIFRDAEQMGVFEEEIVMIGEYMILFVDHSVTTVNCFWNFIKVEAF